MLALFSDTRGDLVAEADECGNVSRQLSVLTSIADIQVAKEVTFMEPRTRPTVVLIDALGSRRKTSKSRPSHSRH
jgi:hypothetical protein